MEKNTDTLAPQPLVSILMLTYNRASYLKEAIASVIAQTYTDWELIVIDDGSTDSTLNTVAEFDDSRIRYIHHAHNEGLLMRRIESLTYARGFYTAVLDSDDYWCDVDKLARQVAFLAAHPSCVVVGTYIKKVDAEGDVLGVGTYKVSDEKIRNSILLRNQFAHSSVLMRTNAIHQTKGYRQPLAEDLELFLQLGVYGTFANIPEYATCCRVHAGNATAHRVKMAHAVHAIVRHYRALYPRYVAAWCMSVLRLVRAYVGI